MFSAEYTFNSMYRTQNFLNNLKAVYALKYIKYFNNLFFCIYINKTVRPGPLFKYFKVSFVRFIDTTFYKSTFKNNKKTTFPLNLFISAIVIAHHS